MRVKCPMCPRVLISLAKERAREKSGYRGGWRLAWDVDDAGCGWKGRSRADSDVELDERVGGVKWCSTRWWRSESLRCDAPWSRGWRADGGNVRDGDVAIDEAWLWWRVCRPEDDARSMVKIMAVLATDDGSDGTVSRPEVRSNSQ